MRRGIRRHSNFGHDEEGLNPATEKAEQFTQTFFEGCICYESQSVHQTQV